MRMTSLRRSRGFSLIELMIGVALGLVILAALTTFFVSSSATRNEIERTSRQIENGRYAVEALRSELSLAGFYAELVTTGTTWTSTDPCLSASAADMGMSLTPLNTPLPVFGYPDDTAKPGCLADLVKGTDVLVIRRFHTDSVPVATAAASQNWYWQPSRCRTDSLNTPWMFSQGSSGGFALRPLTCAGPSNVFRLHVTIFYVRDYSYTQGDGIPTLVKMEVDKGNPMANNDIVTYPLAEGIESMRVEYGVDIDGNGSPDEWHRCDTKDPCDSLVQWPNVVTVRVHLLAKNVERTVGYVDQKVYDMGTGVNAIGPFNDEYKRHVYAAVISMPNRVGPRER
jgi:type IV pilus assembly protein PilW